MPGRRCTGTKGIRVPTPAMWAPGNPAPPPQLPMAPGLSPGREEILRTYRYLFGCTTWEERARSDEEYSRGKKNPQFYTLLSPPNTKLPPSPIQFVGLWQPKRVGNGTVCVNVWVHVCGWVAFNILERGFQVRMKRGMLGKV